MPKSKKVRAGAERRRYQRVKLPAQLRFKRAKETRFKKAIDCLDLSGGGLRILSSQAPRQGEKVWVRIDFKDSSKPVKAVCRVVWHKEAGDDRYTAGLEFVRVENFERFMKFFCDKLIDVSLENA